VSPDTLQALHVSVHALAQQTPSTQNPLPHSVPVVQGTPLGLRPVWHVPLASQYALAPEQRVEALVSEAPAGRFTQLPSWPATLQPWQVPMHALLQQYPSTQLPLPQSVVAAQVWPFGFLFIWQAPPAQYWLLAAHGFCIPVVGSIALWSCDPAGSGAHVPADVPTLHA
jgi:hypothetical protein